MEERILHYQIMIINCQSFSSKERNKFETTFGSRDLQIVSGGISPRIYQHKHTSAQSPYAFSMEVPVNLMSLLSEIASSQHGLIAR